MTKRITIAKEIFIELKDKEVGLLINMEKTKKLSQKEEREEDEYKKILHSRAKT